jgi:hypothetical protein
LPVGTGWVKFAPETSSTTPLRSSSAPLPATSRGLTKRFGARSGCPTSAPVSMTATVTSREPVTASHASVASMSLSAVPAAAAHRLRGVLQSPLVAEEAVVRAGERLAGDVALGVEHGALVLERA